MTLIGSHPDLDDALTVALLAPEDAIERPTGGVWQRRRRGVSRRIEAERSGPGVVVTMTHSPAVAIQHAVAAFPELDWSATSTIRPFWARRMICNRNSIGGFAIREAEGPASFPAVECLP